MESLYPPSPADVPVGLTAPSKKYKRHAWFATLGLLAFIAIYFTLALWFGFTSWHLFTGLANAGDDKFVGNLIGGVALAFLAIFMLKAVFFVKRGETSTDIEITAAEQPQLFSFINKLADEVGAPRAHRVFLSGRVNAAVFYDLSIANLFVASRKNLEIGLPLVNVLNLGELKAVLAHEFGHFAQRTMAVGRWVYIARQIASHIVARRDAMDTFLQKLSNTDIRIAWAGWVLRIVVWAIRSLVDVMFRIVVLAERALSREMEFQADLVSVSVTGSDALINALHKLSAADDAWNRTLSFATDEFRAKRAVSDLFAVQTRVIEKMRAILNDGEYCKSPGMGSSDRRLFKAALAAPPQMWSTHPASSDRENNAKRVFIAAAIDERSAWMLFDDAQALRDKLSKHMAGQEEFSPVAVEESLTKFDEEYSKSYLDRRYQGIYLGRSIARRLESTESIYDAEPEDVVQALDQLYPESLSQDVETLRELESEKSILDALRAGYLTAPGGVIQHRGNQISRKHLPDAIEKVQQEIDVIQQRIWNHDSRCRTVHVAAARKLGNDWVAYLKGLFAIHHYAVHADADLRDAQAVLINTVNVALADGKVSASEFQKIKERGTSLQVVMERIHKEVPEVVPDRTVLNRMKKESWRDAVEELKLAYPDDNNLGQWLNVIHGWVQSLSNSLSSLQWCSLEQLLAAENQVAQFVRQNMQPGAAAPASQVPAKYSTLLPGKERPKQAKLDWWDSFQTATGWLPGIARSIAAAAIVGLVIWFGSSVGSSTVYVYNGLGTPVNAQLGEQKVRVGAFSYAKVDVGSATHLHVRTEAATGKFIEEFDADVSGNSADDVYNIASSGVMTSWTATYGRPSDETEYVQPASRWLSTHAEVILAEPPRSVSTKGGYATRSVFSGRSGESAEYILGLLGNDQAAIHNIALLHARWDEPSKPYLLQWLAVAGRYPEFDDILKQRLAEEPNNIVYLRAEQDAAHNKNYAQVCERHTQMAAEKPDDPNLQYIATRCMTDRRQQAIAFARLQNKWPTNHWIAFGAAYSYAGYMRWKDAKVLFDQVRKHLPALKTRAVDELARVERVNADNENVSLASMRSDSERVYALSLLDGKAASTYPQLRGYQRLSVGDLKQALAYVANDKAEQARLIRLVGASTDATSAQVAAALAMANDQGIDESTYFASLALLVRNNKSIDALLPVANDLFARDGETLLKTFELLRGHAAPSAIDASLITIDPEQRGYMYVAAAVLWGDQCPTQWKRMARQLLFATERPYIRLW